MITKSWEADKKSFKDWVELLFCDDEYVCIGNQYATEPTKVLVAKYKPEKALPEFVTVNPIKDKRADHNVTRMQNFLFELDDMSLEQQKALIPLIKPYVSSIVYSGGKSLHFIVKLQEPLQSLESTFHNIKFYKKVWMEIESMLSIVAEDMVSNLNFDVSCKNPGRFTRVGGATRKEKNTKQEILYIGEAIPYEHFMELGARELESLQEQATKPSNYIRYSGTSTTKEAFISLAPETLLYKLQDKSWAMPTNMYPELFRLTVWAIESTGVSYDCLTEYMEENTFANLLEVGYPKEKLLVPIEHAYEYMKEKTED